MDFPAAVATPTHIHSWSDFMGGGCLRTLAVAGTPGSVTWVANEATYCPLFLPWPYYAARAFTFSGSTGGGNFDIGIYSVDGAKLWSAGSTAQSGTSAIQYVNAGILLSPGAYFLGVSYSGTTNVASGKALTSAALGRAMGYYQQATALPLPSTATFAAYANSGGVPLCGITRTASGF